MTYNGTYGSDDLDDITVDVIATGGVTAVDFIQLIVLIALFIWAVRTYRKKIKK